VLAVLRDRARLIPIGRDGRPQDVLRFARASVLLASGHEPLPPTAVPMVVQVHEAGWLDPELAGLLNREFLEEIAAQTGRAVGRAAQVITPSEAARRDVIAAYGLEPQRVHAIHHGVDGVFRRGLSGGRELVAAARDGRDAPYVLYAATLHPRKNLAVLREAMTDVARAGLPHVLAIAGRPAPDRPDSSELIDAAAAELAGAPGRIAFLGEPSDLELAALMAGAGAFCLPSLYEGFGLTVLEAMACGAPVVVSDRGALPEVVAGAGLVVEPARERIAAALIEVLSDPARAARLGSEAAARAREFSWERTAEGWLAVLRAAA
jgi:glycosyltransferase involved in cell wall biosynthesis